MGSGQVVFANLHPGDVSSSFSESTMHMAIHDFAGAGHLLHTNDRGGATFGHLSIACGAGRIADGRNAAASRFLLAFPDAEWLLFVDSDMGFERDALDRLLAVADPVERPVVGALCFAAKHQGTGSTYNEQVGWVPTVYRQNPDGTFGAAYDYPRDTVVEVAGTGAAFVLIHRGVLERIANDAGGPVWFDNLPAADGRSWQGEDLSFCRRVRDAGFSVHVHTGVRTSHHKDVWFTEDDYAELRQPASTAVTVVIPVKDNLAMTRALVGQLYEQGGYTDILIMDNGSTDPEMVDWLRLQEVADVFDASGLGIHHMWNAGVDEAVSRHGGRADVVLLNNDISIGPRFLRRLIRGLHVDPSCAAVCGNYDGRPASGTVPVFGICANRYDGSGGLAGFAYAISAEWIASGYRFPESMQWWYGDNDLCLSIERAGGWYGLVADAGVVHLDGGSQTATPDGWAEIVAADRAAFEAKWPDVVLTSAA